MKRMIKCFALSVVLALALRAYLAMGTQVVETTVKNAQEVQGSIFSARQVTYGITNSVKLAVSQISLDAKAGEREVIDVPASVKDVDFTKTDAVAWIYIPSINLSYPVYQGEDNEYFLKHTAEGKRSSHGEIFMNASNNSDFSDENTIIFGHNMKDRTMFGTLKNVNIEDYIWVVTKDHTYTYQIFSTYSATEKSSMFVTFDKGQHNAYVEKALGKSTQKSDVNTDGRILTLVTCQGIAHSGQRLFVHGSLVQTL